MEQEHSGGLESMDNITSKDPWDMTEEEFVASAEKGKLHTLADEEEDVIAVANGTKPVAVISCASSSELPAMLKSSKVINKIDYKFFTHPESTHTKIIIVRKGEDIDGAVDTYINFFYDKGEEGLKPKPVSKLTPEKAIERGKFFGYSDDDINHFLNQNFGYKRVVEGHKIENKLDD